MSSEKLYDELISKLDDLLEVERNEAYKFFVDDSLPVVMLRDDCIFIDVLGPEDETCGVHKIPLNINLLATEHIKSYDNNVNDIESICSAFEALALNLRTMVEERKLKGH